jgi:hypothetical protein
MILNRNSLEVDAANISEIRFDKTAFSGELIYEAKTARAMKYSAVDFLTNIAGGKSTHKEWPPFHHLDYTTEMVLSFSASACKMPLSST